MSVVRRTARAYPPDVPDGEIRLEPPPELERHPQQGWVAALLPVMSMLGSAGFMFMPGASRMMMVMGGLMTASSLVVVVSGLAARRGGRHSASADRRRDYLRYLDGVRRQARLTAQVQRSARLWTHPDPDQLWSVVADPGRVWERRAADSDFGQVRIGLGRQRLATPLVAPRTGPLDTVEPLCADTLRRLLRTLSTLDDMPVAVSLRAFPHVTLAGEEERALGVARAIVAQLAALHSPADVVLAVAVHPRLACRWDWVKWLPHAWHPSEVDGAGPVRLLAGDLGTVEGLLSEELANRPRFTREGRPLTDRRHVVLVVDGLTVDVAGWSCTRPGLQGVTVLEVVPGTRQVPTSGLCAVAGADTLVLHTPDGEFRARADRLEQVQAEALARRLAPLRPDGHEGGPLTAGPSFVDLMGAGDAASVDATRAWRPRPPHDLLRVPIGVGENGDPVLLDLKESALEGMGPHGLCVGATGSGKSELLRSLVLALAMTHSSQTLNFVLADFKGGATFSGMSRLPHVAAVITNLADDMTLVDRMRDALTGELNRRQELLRAAGHYASVHDYERARASGTPLRPLPSLMLVLDEFSELLSAQPDFIDMFLQIGRIGRSLGVHLLLASQRLEEGRLRGLDTYLSYRIGLRTFSAAESRAVLGVPDAHQLPPLPGSGYLTSASGEMVRFTAAYVSAPYTAAPHERGDARDRVMRPVPFTTARVAALPVTRSAAVRVTAGREGYRVPRPTATAAGARAGDTVGPSVLDVIVGRLEGQGPPAHRVWLPPLEDALPLQALLPPRSRDAGGGRAPSGWGGSGRLRTPVGVIDRPFEQCRDVLFVDLSGAAGNVVVVGGPRSGKSTALRTVILSYALTHTPREVQFYCLDLSGGALASISSLPHVGSVAERMDVDLVRRTVSEVRAVLDRREALFRDQRIDGVAAMRARRATGELSGGSWGDVFLVVDGWLTLRNDFEDLEAAVTDIAVRGLGYGVHVVVAVGRWAELRPALKDQLQTRLELRLGDPVESEVDRRSAARVPAGAPGRGLTPDGLHFLTALPRLDDGDGTDVVAATRRAARRVADVWPGPAAPPVRVLPTTLTYESLLRRLPSLGQARAVPIGVDESALDPVFLDFTVDPHFIVFGETESGKTAFLRTLVRGVCARYTPQQARIVVADYRRTLLDAVPPEHLLAYAAAAPALSEFVTEITGSLQRRMPGAQVTQEQLRSRSWWTGPEVFVVVDDYDLVASAGGSPLAALVDFLPLARDVGLHLVVARGSGGAGRSLFEPVMQRLRDLGTPGLLLSGSPDEGALLGQVRPTPLPAGRGRLVTRRGGTRLVQTAWCDGQPGTGESTMGRSDAAPPGSDGTATGHRAP